MTSTAQISQPGQIIIRQIPFSFEEAIDPIWNPRLPEWSHMANGASLAMPYLEPFLIKTVREALKNVDDPALKKDVHGFMGQEGQHFQNHRRYNEILKQHYPQLAAVEDEMDADYRRFQNKSLKWRLAYTAGFETMTMGITEWLIKQRSDLFGGADPSVTSLLLWHMVEETEHKNVAYDLYMHLYGGYFAKARGLAIGAWHVAWCSRKGYRVMLKRDGQWSNWRSRLAVYAMVVRFVIHTGPALVRSLLPGYHPSKVKDPDWVSLWTSAYADLPKDAIPLLDTQDAEIPAQFAQ